MPRHCRDERRHIGSGEDDRDPLLQMSHGPILRLVPALTERLPIGSPIRRRRQPFFEYPDYGVFRGIDPSWATI